MSLSVPSTEWMIAGHPIMDPSMFSHIEGESQARACIACSVFCL